MDIAFLITTYNRQESCQRLVNRLVAYGDVYVFNDGSDYNISGATQLKRQNNLGKRGYWRSVNALFAMRGNHKYYFMLPDDFMPADDMVNKALAIWNSINDPQKICLSISEGRPDHECWTKFTAIEKDTVWLTQWVDMCFMCEDKFFQRLGVLPQVNAQRSSGVGRYISKYLHHLRLHMYQVKESLVIPTEEHLKSQMHKRILHDNSRHSNAQRARKIF